MTPAVVARALVKHFKDIVAVEHLDLEVPTGISFGVLGPNGAGKTTAMRMISCVTRPTSGELVVLGEDVGGDRRRLKARIGVVPQGMTLDEDLTVRENLFVHARYHGLSRRLADERCDELLTFAQLDTRAKAKIGELSGGMQRRLLIARALVNDPELVILDEPTTGLDPQARQLVWERLRGLRSRGKTLLITTHYMDEAARLCDHLIVVDHGRVIARGTPVQLIADHVAPRVVEVHGGAATEADVRGLLDGTATDVEVVGDRVLAYGRDSGAIVAKLMRAKLADVTLLERDATLEDVFLRLTGHQLVD